jgi:hypothetical protein
VNGCNQGHTRHGSVGAKDAEAASAQGITAPQYLYDHSMKRGVVPKGEYDRRGQRAPGALDESRRVTVISSPPRRS